MIVISGALVLVALVLLIVGLVGPSLGFVYASIGVSLAAFAFLIVGVLQRRKLEVPATPGILDAALAPSGMAAADPIEEVVALPPVARKPAGAAEPATGTVLVVAGRPRYHVEGCRYLTGKEADEVDVAEAREEGFTACGVCKPDDNLSAPVAVEIVDEPSTAPDVEVVEAPAVTSLVKTPAARPAAAKTSAARSATVAKAAVAAKAPSKAPVKTTAAKAAATKTAATKTAATKTAATKTAVAKAPAKAAASPAKKAAAAPLKRGSVIVIPDRGKYHTADCRYVRGAEGTLELTKAAATKQGYAACGVCNP